MKNTSLVALIISTVFAATVFATEPDTPINNKKTITTTLIPETPDNKFNIGISAGTTLPLKDFKASGAASDSSHIVGSAQTGIHFNLTAGYTIYKIVGAMVMVGGNINSFGGGASLGSSAIIPSGPHYVGQYLAGPYISVPIGKKFFIEAHTLVGLITSHYPDLSTDVSASLGTYGSYDYSTATKFKSGKAFGYSGSLGAKYMLGEHFGISLNAAYSGSHIKYPSYMYTTTGTSSGLLALTGTNLNINTSTTHSNIHMSLGMINISAGVVFSF